VNNKAMPDDAISTGCGARYDGTRFRRIVIDGVGIHYQEAGDPSKPHVILLHGFPSTSRMWDRLIPTLATKYHVIAPDYPGFGLSDAPPPEAFTYTFQHIATMMGELVTQLGIRRYAMVMQDYGGPIGFRMAMAAPHSTTAMIVQNAAAYDVALGPTWDARKAFWQNPALNRKALQQNLLSFDTARTRHVGQSPNPDLYDPNTWHDEFAMLNRAGMIDIHMTLFYDYRNNVASYAEWQAWLRERTAAHAGSVGPLRSLVPGRRRGGIRAGQSELHNAHRRCRPFPDGREAGCSARPAHGISGPKYVTVGNTMG
jgi:pimeloyl-ACP methyl ester carboxylesterase